MTNDYFSTFTALPRNTLARAEAVNTIFNAIVVGFDKLPSMASLKEGRINFSADTGTANHYVLTLDTAIVAYTTGLRVSWQIAHAATGASDINVNGIGVATLTRYDGTPILTGDLPLSGIGDAVYDGANFRLVSPHISDPVAAAASAAAAAASAAAAAVSAAAALVSQTATAASAASAAGAVATHAALTSTHGVTGNIVGTDGVQTLSSKTLASPIITGTLTAAASTFSGAITYGGVTLSNSVTGTGSMVLSAGAALTGAVTIAGGASSPLDVGTTATSNAFNINAQGDIGVGTILAPDATHHLSFEILRNTNTDAAQTLRNRNNGASARAVWHGFAGATDQVDFGISIAAPAAGGNVNLNAGGTTGGLNIIVSAADFMAFFTTNLERYRITAGGHVLIGTTTDSAMLTVNGTAQINSALTLSGALTYGGVTLSNAVTGTGNMVLSASPTLTGTAIVSAVTASGQFLLNKSGGGTAGAIYMSSAVPAFAWNATGQAADNKLWDMSLNATAFVGRAVNDAESSATSWLSVVRSGITISSITLTGTTIALTGALTVSSTTTLSGALTYGGVTLSNAVTGTGNMVLSASPTLTGTISAAALTLSGVLTYGGVALSAAVTGTGNMVLSASPTLTGTLTAATATFSGVVTHSSTTTLSGALTYGGVTLSNAVTGTGNMVLSASPTLTGTVSAAALTLSGALSGVGASFSDNVTVAAGKVVKMSAGTLAALGSATTAGAGARSVITDCNSTVFNAVAAGGSSNTVPVFSDGLNWHIG